MADKKGKKDTDRYLPFSKCIVYSWEDLFVYLRLLKGKGKGNEYLSKKLPAINTYKTKL